MDVARARSRRPAWRPPSVGSAGVVTLALLVVVCLLAVTRPAAAQEPDEGEANGVTLRAEAGISGFVAPGRAFPITVTIATDRLVDGTIEAAVPGMGAAQVVERPVEVSGGSTARFTLLAPAAPDSAGRATVRLVGAGVAAEATAEWNVDLGQELVGVFPEPAGPSGSLPGAVPLVVDAGVARLVAIEPELLDGGALVLEPLDQVVASPGEVADLGEDAKAALLTWIDGGGQLVVAGDGAAAALDQVLPPEWRPVQGGGQRAGLGQVRAVGDDWQRTLAPSPTRSTLEEEIMASDLGSFVDESLAQRLGEDAGFDLPEPGRLAWLLAGYVALMGPVAFMVVRRLRRREVAWVGLPALAMVSTGLVFATGSSLRDAAETAQVTVYEVGPDGALATTWSLVPSAHGGEVGVELPEGWSGRAADDGLGPDFGVDVTGRPLGQTGGSDVRLSTGADARLVQDVGPGGFALLEARGPATEMAGALGVTATSAADGEVTGTVRNTLDVPLHEVAAFAGRARAVEIGTLAAGETRDFRIADATRFAWGDPPEPGVWPIDPDGAAVMPGPVIIDRAVVEDGTVLRAEVGAGGDSFERADDGDGDRAPVVLSAWNQTLRRTGSNYRPSGQVVLAGWTDELAAPVSPTGGRAERITTAVVARATPVPTAGRLTDTASVKSVVRGPATQSPPNHPDVEAHAGIGFIQSFDLPDQVGGRPVDPQRLVINPGALFITFEFWTPQGWVPIEPPAAGQEERVVPPDAVVGGTVYMRISVPTDVVPPAGRDLVIYEREAPS